MNDRQKEARDWLNRNYIEWKELQKLKQRLELSESMLSNGVSRLTKNEIQVEHAGNSQEEKLIETSFLRQQVEERLASLDRADALTIEIIGTITDAEQRLILISRYILRDSWNKIERDMNYSRRSLFRLHEKALAEAYQKILVIK